MRARRRLVRLPGGVAAAMEIHDAVLAVMITRNGNWYGLDIAKAAHLNAGRLYPVLARLEQDGLVASDWDLSIPSQHRRVYWVTEAGQTKVAM